MASFPLRWWRAMLSLAEHFGGQRRDRWVEPSNHITRAVLSGDIPMLATQREQLLASAPDAFDQAASSVPPAAAAPAAKPAEASPAAAASRRRRRPGRAA